ncbi:P-loop NTPase family protein [Microbacterium halophytorum]|uniref:AAA family ATPase n=1 Tax=Microbacterium halophytorum TaxID=2067568 RepID=UPI000CFB343A|nr:AAA family ATPase [Microbacterium halophytorum]
MPFDHRRILVAGVTGVGKTTLAARVGRLLDVPHVEIDDLHWGPGWAPRPDFLDEVRKLASSGAWVTEWQYSDARPILLDRAQALVWIDLPFRVQYWRLIKRTVRRRVRRVALWRAGMVEPPLWTIFTNPEHILRWGWRTRNKYRREFGDVLSELAARDDFEFVHLRSVREVDRWVASLR